ncbi:phosphate--AMP phosphotransferase [Natronospora cellulosivora (SeqCode)]
MLEELDLSKKLSKEEYKDKIDTLYKKAGKLQRQAKELNIPIIILFEGWDAAGKGTLINKLIHPIDPRGFKHYLTKRPNEEEKRHPFLWRFWRKIPERGQIAIMNRSWYQRVVEEFVEYEVPEQDWAFSYKDINFFEKQLVNDNYLILKFFLHISKEEQKKRFLNLSKNKATSWRVNKEDWKHHHQYQLYLHYYNRMIDETDKDYASWEIIEAENHEYATLKIFKYFVDSVENKIQEVKEVINISKAEDEIEENTRANDDTLSKKITSDIQRIYIPSALDKIDLSKEIAKDSYKAKVKEYQEKIRNLQHKLYRDRLALVIVYEGWDGAGKGGNIRRLTEMMDPRGYQVFPVAAPSEVEKSYHYLWRFWQVMPKAGHITIFDRSWYGRVLVERIEGFCAKNDWQRAYQEINEMEEQLYHFGTVIIKFWLHIDKDTQLKRFEDRKNNPNKRWKLTEEDWRNREKWDQYKIAIDEMIDRTSTKIAPWTIVEANSKHYARIKVMETIIARLEEKLNSLYYK